MLKNIVSKTQSSESSTLPGCLKKSNKRLFFFHFIYFNLFNDINIVRATLAKNDFSLEVYNLSVHLSILWELY